MKILKGVLIFIAIVALILIVVTILLPSKVEIERSKVIAAPQDVLFDQVNNLKKWTHWSPWHQLDPDMSVEYSDENPSGEGAWYSWEGDDQVGSGKLTIVDSDPNQRIRTEMYFAGSDDPAFADMTFEKTDGGTKVTWSFDAEMSGAEKWFGLMVETLLGPQYEEGLNNLDSVATNLPKEMPVANAEEFELEDTWYVGYIIETTQEEVSNSENYEKGLGAVHMYLKAEGIESIAQPMTILRQWERESVVMEMAIPVADSLDVPDSLTMGRIPGGRALKMKHMGDYENLAETWQTFEDYNAANEVIPRWYPYEVYVTDPSEQPDTSKWVTEIVFPVE